jgi:hypothetical protein
MTYRLRFLGLALLWAAAASRLSGQVDVNCNTLVYEQNFNSLLATDAGPAPCARPGNLNWTDNSTLTGWFVSVSNSSTYGFFASDGKCGTGSFYSYGLPGDADRAFGALGGGGSTGDAWHFGVRFVNKTGRTIKSIKIRYMGETWRRGNISATLEQGLVFNYQKTAANLNFTGTPEAALNYNLQPPGPATELAVNGNLPANRAMREATLNVTLDPNESIILRWTAFNENPGIDDGHGIDDPVSYTHLTLPTKA